ncbi:WD40-repeat-containing domain protein [Hygrophoropsis aurantiaca]|uniref:WD40-repeat-containing domain protein n=1 Tax=Hygrophoropsis aurantiaca TaxID=72124 RepID=A0ACB8AK88_9AGAM|nr:WD40-repeat-containing domain protein [Hygrophoropsis aurantiaca]
MNKGKVPEYIDVDDLDIEIIAIKRPCYTLDDSDSDGKPSVGVSAVTLVKAPHAHPIKTETALSQALRGAIQKSPRMEPARKRRTTDATLALVNQPPKASAKRKASAALQPTHTWHLQSRAGSAPNDAIEISSDEEAPPPKKTKISSDDSPDPILLQDSPLEDYMSPDPILLRPQEAHNASTSTSTTTTTTTTTTTAPTPSTSASTLASTSALTHPDNPYDDEEEYSNYMASLDLRDESNWTPCPVRDKDDTPNFAFEHMSISASVPNVLRPHRTEYINCRYPPPKPIAIGDECDDCPWVKLAKYRSKNKRPHRYRLPQMLQSTLQRPRAIQPLFKDMGYHMLGLARSYRRVAAGSITKIVQTPGNVVVGSTVWQGHANYPGDEEESLGNENMQGNLLLWNGGKIHAADAHYRTRSSINGVGVQKYYTVNDVAFDPTRADRFASSGNDFTVQLWDIVDASSDSTNKIPKLANTIRLPDVAQDLHFKPNESTLVVSCRNGTVLLFSSLDESTQASSTTFHVAPASPRDPTLRHAAGAMTWGTGPTSHNIFTSSEPLDPASDIGYHKVFDVVKQMCVNPLSAAESGDAMALHPDGRTLALMTATSSSHHLRLYDVRRTGPQPSSSVPLPPTLTIHPTAQIPLVPYAKYQSYEVNCASFSPDGLFLAVARNDNITHVYDTRNIGRDVLYGFPHQDPHRGVPGTESYGVVEAQWVTGRGGRGMGLVTGGNDGCVRFWDCGISASDNSKGKAIAKTDFDVAHFSLGDQHKGEKALVVGHCGGGVYIFDKLTGDMMVEGDGSGR